MNDLVPRRRWIEAPAWARFWPVVPAEPWSDLQTERLELISRGDLVSGLRVRARDASPRESAGLPGLLVLVHDAAGDANAPEWRPVARWIARSERTVVVALDLPLHGPRTSPKLSERLVSAFAALARGAFLDRNGAVLVDEFLIQAAHDLARTVDAMLRPGDLDPNRVALIGLGLGARVADAYLADDNRVRAAVMVRTRRAPVPTPGPVSAGSTHRLELDAQDGHADWATPAERFLASRIGL